MSAWPVNCFIYFNYIFFFFKKKIYLSRRRKYDPYPDSGDGIKPHIDKQFVSIHTNMLQFLQHIHPGCTINVEEGRFISNINLMYIIRSNVHVNQPTACLMLLLLIDVDKAIQNMHKSSEIFINYTNCVIDKYLFFPYSIISSYQPVLKSVF